MNELPLKLHKPGTEWLVELRGPVDGQESVCGLFHSKDEAAARAFYDNAHRILSWMKKRSVWVVEATHPGRKDGWNHWGTMRDAEIIAEADAAICRHSLRGTGWKFRVVRYDASK